MIKYNIFLCFVVFGTAIFAKNIWKREIPEEKLDNEIKDLETSASLQNRVIRQTPTEKNALDYYYTAANMLKREYKAYLDNPKGDKWKDTLTKARKMCEDLQKQSGDSGWIAHAKKRCVRATQYMTKSEDESMKLCPYNNFVYDMVTRYKAGKSFKKFTCGDIDVCRRTVDVKEEDFDAATISSLKDGRTSFSICRAGFTEHRKSFPAAIAVETNPAAAKSFLGCSRNYISAYPNSTLEKCPTAEFLCGFKIVDKIWSIGCCGWPSQFIDEPQFIEDSTKNNCDKFDESGTTEKPRR